MAVQRTICIVTVDGQDVSSAILPRLISLSVTDKAGTSSDTVSITLNDEGGNILLPEDGASIEVQLGGEQSGVATVFKGVVDEVRSSGSRSSGMTLTISGKGFDTKGKPKQPQSKHWDDKSLGDVFKEAAQLAGIGDAKVADELASIQRPYWAMQNESFIHWAERIAREVGGTFKVVDDVAILAKRNGGLAAGGGALAPVSAVYGENLISWDISPVLGRPRYKKAKARWYDPKKAEWKVEVVEVEDPDAEAEFYTRFSSADDGEAEKNAESRKVDSEREKGGGSITLNGTADPQPEGTVTLVGARPGIDGTYRIDTVNQEFSRGSGWTTRLDLKQPQGEAGKDNRGTSGASSAASSSPAAAPSAGDGFSGGWRLPD